MTHTALKPKPQTLNPLLLMALGTYFHSGASGKAFGPQGFTGFRVLGLRVEGLGFRV